MRISGRLARILQARGASAPAAEDPFAALDRAHAEQSEVLGDVRRTVADLITSRKRVELQARRLALTADELHREAARAVAGGRDDAAREALTRQVSVEDRLAELAHQHAELRQQEEALVDASQRLAAELDALRARMAMLRATSSAVEGRARVQDALRGVAQEGSDAGLALRRAEERTALLRARADALDELGGSAAAAARADAELDRVLAQSRIDQELARLRGASPPDRPFTAPGEDHRGDRRS